MTARDHVAEIGDGDARVERGGRQTAMAEQRLDMAQIGAAAQQMRRAGVPQRVRRESHAQATARELDTRAETDRAEPRAGASEEERRFGTSHERRSALG